MLIAEFQFNMDPDYTDMGSNFYGAGKGHTYEQPDARKYVNYRRMMPWLVQPHPRAVALPEELETTSQIVRGVREEIRDRVGAALAGVEIGLHSISSASSMDAGPFHDYSDDFLLKLEQYAAYYRDNYKRVVARQNENRGMVCKYAIIYEIYYMKSNVFNI